MIHGGEIQASKIDGGAPCTKELIAASITEQEKKVRETLEEELVRVLNEWGVYALASEQSAVRKRMQRKLVRELLGIVIGFHR